MGMYDRDWYRESYKEKEEKMCEWNMAGNRRT